MKALIFLVVCSIAGISTYVYADCSADGEVITYEPVEILIDGEPATVEEVEQLSGTFRLLAQYPGSPFYLETIEEDGTTTTLVWDGEDI